MPESTPETPAQDAARDAPEMPPQPVTGGEATAGVRPPPGFQEKKTERPWFEAVKLAALNQWQRTEALRGAARRAVSGMHACAAVRVLDGVLHWTRVLYPPDCWDTFVSRMPTVGHFSLGAAQLLTFFFFLLAGLKSGRSVLIGQGVLWATLLLVLQFAAHKLECVTTDWVRNTPSRLSSAVLPDCLTYFFVLVGLATGGGGAVVAWQVGQWNVIFVGLGGLLLGKAAAFLALHPVLLNVTTGDALRPSEEALGLVQFAGKVMVRLAPVAYGLGSLCGTLGLLLGTLGLIVMEPAAVGSGLRLPGFGPLCWVTLCTAWPLASYLVFAFAQLLVDFLRPTVGGNASKGHGARRNVADSISSQSIS